MRSTLSYRVGLFCLLVAATTAIAFLSTDGADAKTGYEPVCNIKNIMNALNHEETGLFGAMLKFCASNPDKGNDGWALARHQAAMLAEGGQLLTEMDPPKGDPASWVAKAEAFRDAAKDLKKPLAMRKPDQTKEQLEVVRKTCNACHDAHRPS